MRITRFISGIVLAASLGACATEPPAPPKAPPTLAAYVHAADVAAKAGKPEEAGGWLKAAIAAFPADKTPRLRMAQLQFECQNYGDAIARAQEVLDRDPDDLVAHSLVAVSGLRVSSKALADLARKNNLTGDVRAEAQDLARILRANVGGELIPAPKKKVPAMATVKPPTAAAVPKGADKLTDWLNN
jgi:tetratricopeptide (TPR) repeat protein